MSANEHLLVVYNPACGHSKAKALFHKTVIPLLEEHGKKPEQVIETTHEGHAGEIIAKFLSDVDDDIPISVILGSGDGTLHEIVLALARLAPSTRARKLSFVLVPCGTANALYASLFPATASTIDTDPEAKLTSLHAFLASAPSSRSLTIARTTFTSSAAAADNDARSSSSISVVVASTSLHASILHDSEALRATHPGIERFKIAAQQNITRWYQAKVRLLPASSLTPVQVYDPGKKVFVDYASSDQGESIELSGPFAYFLSTVNVDRLEPAFRITPLHISHPPPARPEPATIDIVILRPSRDKATAEKSGEEARKAFAEKCTAVLYAAYRDGAHVNMAYKMEDGTVIEDGEGDSVVEYFRCGGWEWIPVSRLGYSQNPAWVSER